MSLRSLTHKLLLQTKSSSPPALSLLVRRSFHSPPKQLDNNGPINKIRYNYSKECEQLVNEQINHEMNAWYFYVALGTYFSQPTVALPGVANYFLSQSSEERSHAQSLIHYQNGRGGKVQFQQIQAPPDFADILQQDHITTKGFELAIEAERAVYDQIRHIYKVAESHGDFALTGFLQKLIDEQVESLKELQELYTKSKRMMNDYFFDQLLESTSTGEIRQKLRGGQKTSSGE